MEKKPVCSKFIQHKFKKNDDKCCECYNPKSDHELGLNMSWVRKAGQKIQNFVTGDRHDDDSTTSSGDQGKATGVQHENLDLSSVAKVLILGETGSGKSTFINYLTNYFRDGSLKNLKIAIPSKFHPIPTEQFAHCERNIQNNTQSKTDDCNQYMFSTNSKQYLFIDTPGLSDTRGATQDDQNIMKIVESAESLGGLTAVIIVVNGAVARLTVNLRNVLVRLRGNLPDIVMDNVIVVLTNSTHYAANFTIEALGMSGNIYPFYMQNSAFSQDPNTWTPSAMQALQLDWNQAMDEIKYMIKTIDTFKIKSVGAFKQMKDIRNEIKSLLHTARVEVSQIQRMQDEIAAFEAALSMANNDLVTYNDYTTEREVEKVQIVDAPYHSTLCQNCNHVCHDACGLDESTIAGSQIFQQCWAITNGSCTECTHKCLYTAHYHARKTVKITKETLQDVLADIKAKYDQAATNKSNYQNQITSVEDAKKLLENALKQKSDDIKKLCIELHAICSGFNLAQELYILIDQLEVEAKMLKNIDAKRQADEFIRSLKELCDTIGKDENNANKNLPQMKIINIERSVADQANGLAPPLPNRDIPSPVDSRSHANEDALAAIRAIAKKKAQENDNLTTSQNQGQSQKKVNEKTGAKKSLNKKVNRSEVYTSDSDERSEKLEKNNNTSDENEEESKKGKKLNKKKGVSDDINEEELKQLSITELLTRHHACKNDYYKANFFIHELEQRSVGASAGPLIEPAIRIAYTRSTQKYCAYSSDALTLEYDRLKKFIAGYTKPNILKIGQIPSDTLIDISVIYELLQNQRPEMNNQSLNVTPHGQQSRYSPSFGTVYDPRPPQYYQPYNDLHQHGPRINYPHAVRYPLYHDQPYSQQREGFQPINRPTPVVPSNVNTAFQDMRIESKPYDNFDAIRQSPQTESFSTDMNSVHSSPTNYGSRSDNINETGTMTNAQLISAYKDAFSRSNYAKSHEFYSELKRRCYGEYPTLIQSNPVLFNEIYSKYQHQPLEELDRGKISIQQMINNSLVDGDATRIDEIPKELIIEAAVLNHLIAAQTART